MSGSPTLTYCARELRRHDRDRYLACLFAPATRREALFTLHAFNLEVARTAESVSEPLIGRIRLQWWRESIAGIYDGQPRHHAVVEPLAEAVRRHGLSRDRFERLIDGREFDLELEPPDDLERLLAYGEATSSELVCLALEVLDAADETSLVAGRHLGRAWALTGLLRAVPFHARTKRLYLPRDLVEAAGVDLAALFELRGSPALAEVVARVAAAAARELAAARASRGLVAGRALPALLPATLAARYLTVLAKAGHDPFDPRVRAEVPGQVWRLAWARLLGRY